MEVAIPIKYKIHPEQVIDGMTQQGMAMAIWKLPNEKEIHLLGSSSASSELTELDLVDSQAAFAIAPFDSEERQAYLLPSDFISTWELGDPKKEKEAFRELSEHFGIETTTTSNTKKENLQKLLTPKDTQVNEQKIFESTVTKAVTQIENGVFDKVVISRKKDFTLKEHLNIYNHFNDLTLRYPEAFVSMVYLPWLEEFWLGASPEILVQQEGDIFRTVSLAGTQSAFDEDGNEIPSKEALWSQKEIEEQALVSRYIINRFKTVRVREFKEVGPRSVKAGKLIHLKSTFEVNTQDIGFREMPTVMLGLLHPTSAVCGLPKEAALSFIKNNEVYDRSFYSGFLGPINIKGSTQLFVNLRNLKKHKNTITTYAGCGITADSNPSKEWLETELKMNTILGI